MIFTRYAIFYTPPPGQFADFGAAWLGWNTETGDAPTPPVIADLPAPLDEITRIPRKYGFHGTIKPPFHLSQNVTQAELQKAFSDFCANHAPVTLDGVELAQLGRFLALVPSVASNTLNDLAANTVVKLDHFRAPLSGDELAQRRKAKLSPTQDAMLLKWGYPYVMQDFRFHMTLTGKLPKAQARTTQHALMPHLNALIPVPFSIDSLSLMGEGEQDGMFRLIQRCPLTGTH